MRSARSTRTSKYTKYRGCNPWPEICTTVCLNAVVSQRQKRTGFLKKAVWALYDGKNFDKLVEQITGFVDDLEKLFPVEAVRHSLVEMEIEEIRDDEASLQTLQGAARDMDQILSEVVSKRLDICGGKNYAANS